MDSQDIPLKLAHAALYATLRLCTASGTYPRCLALQEIDYERKPIASGAFGDIWKGYHKKHPVCLKVARVYQGSDVEHIIKVSKYPIPARAVNLSFLTGEWINHLD